MDITLPDGTVIRGVPEGTTRAQLTAKLKAAGYDVSKLAPQEAPADPTGGFVDNTLAGIGSGMSSVVRALGGGGLLQRFGLPGTKEEAEQIDAPLMRTAGGQVGRVVGTAAPAALAIPFTPATLAGAVVSGGLTGAAMTEGDLGDRALGGTLGAAGGAVAGAAPYAMQFGRNAARAISEPFTTAGRQRIAGRAIERFATRPLPSNLSNAPTVTGALPTLAEATQDTGLATLQRAIGTADPEAAALLAARQEANNAARLESLRVLAGGATQPASRVGRLNRIATGQPTRQAAEATREAAAAQSYGAARQAGVNQEMADALQPQIANLLERPEIQRAAAQAREYARSDSLVLDELGSVQGLQYLKQALDDQIEALPPRAKNARRLYTKSSADLKSVLDEITPALRQADREFQMNSVPVNRAAVGERLLERTTGAIRDFSGNRKLQANAFAKALNDEAQLLRQSTGFGGVESLDDILTATQSGRVNAVRNELETLANLNNAANGPGSQTAKMLASQNLLQQLAGPMGMPQSWIESALAQTVMRPVQFGFKAAEPRIGANIAEALLDPAQAQALINAARVADVRLPPNAIQLLLQRTAPAMIGAASGQAAGQ
jgi:hypothetical protein